MFITDFNDGIMNKLKISGLLYLIAGSIALMGIITAEAFYPSGLGYTTFTNEISDLGATKSPNSLIFQPSSGNKVPYHGIFSLLTFTSGGISAVLSYKIISAPFKYVGIFFGSISLVTWCAAVFAANIIISFVVMSGAERWLVYPIVLWITGFGGYLMNTKTTTIG